MPKYNENKPYAASLKILKKLHRLVQSHASLFCERETLLLNELMSTAQDNQGTTGLSHILSWFNFFGAVDEPISLQINNLMIRHKIAQEINNGVEQLLFIGSGYDLSGTLCALKYPDIKVYELDYGTARENKLNMLKKASHRLNVQSDQIIETEKSVHMNGNLLFINSCIADAHLTISLNQHGFSSTKKTLVVLSELTTHLTQEQNSELLDSLFNLLNDQSIVLIQFASELDASSDSQFAVSPQYIADFASDHGFDVLEQFDATALLPATSWREPYKNNYYSFRKLDDGFKVVVEIDQIPTINVVLPACLTAANTQGPQRRDTLTL